MSKLSPIAAMAGVLTLAAVVPALAHPRVVGTAPQAGVEVKSPKEIRVEFALPVDADTAEFRIANDAGKAFLLGRVRVDPQRATALIVPVADTLPAGTYVVKWSVSDHEHDGVPGGFGFKVGR